MVADTVAVAKAVSKMSPLQSTISSAVAASDREADQLSVAVKEVSAAAASDTSLIPRGLSVATPLSLIEEDQVRDETAAVSPAVAAANP
jgi:hypothetical protein